MDARRIQTLDDLLRRLAGAVKVVNLYSSEHPIVSRAFDQLFEIFDRLLADDAEIVMGIVEGQLVVDSQPILGGPGAAETLERLRNAGIDRLTVTRGVTRDELREFVRRLPALGSSGPAGSGERSPVEGTDHIRITRLRFRAGAGTVSADNAGVRQAYRDAVSYVEQVWNQTAAEGRPDPALAQEVVEGLAQMVGQNRRTLVALTALCQYDNYTFTHMVNVSALTMAQARSLGIEGVPLRQFGMAGLMHDIGKIHTPAEILTKPDKLTDDEMVIMKRHPVDGADILRRQLEIPPLAAIVAFEHHLRIDATGYPTGVTRPSLNLATQLCAIADVYDAMRSQRSYQQAFPTDRIQAVLQQNDGTRFDRHLVRRFSQLMGIYPPGTLVRLDTGALAVVIGSHAPDPARPAVRVIVDSNGAPLATPVDLALWDETDPSAPPPRIVSPVNPIEAGIDPLAFLDSPSPLA